MRSTRTSRAKFCDWSGQAGATRVRAHILRSGCVAKCKGSASGDEYDRLKAKLETKVEGKKAEKEGQLVAAEMNAVAEVVTPQPSASGGRQQAIQRSIAAGSSEEIDNAIAVRGSVQEVF